MDLDELLANARRNEALLQRLQRYELQLLACQDWFDLLSTLIDGLPQQFELDAIALQLADADDSLSQSIHRSLDIDHAHLMEHVELTSTVEVIDASVLSSPEPYQSGLALPLRRNQDYLGQLRLFSHHPQRFHAGMATDFMQHLAAVVAACLVLVQKTEEQARLALTDPLTGAENRRGFDKAFQREWARGQRQYHVFSLILFDLDFFKKINDLHGHGCGDRVLTSLCQTLMSSLRPTDHLGRLGGEEFALLLPGCSADELPMVVQRLQDAIHAMTVHNDEGERLDITVSGSYLAVTPRAHHSAELDAFIRHLDQWLYQAKRQGRDCFLQAVG
ncbi:hypothetical protein CHH28_12150 [Bacterioplanes sanyensis]|uniref:diguanylate cyclase n=1 Tax=Bacterioplanes sanyensis TaxID=1249553 RepID=A0A222FLA6_9GAMM|nr:DUF484 family protein [Bacterioplanes sanyensis]ASP39376.1 hypothetical protein CHH28_12150 [Bacterioplanes sanyensis]